MDDPRYSRQALLQAPAVDEDPDRLRYLVGRLPALVNRIRTAVESGDRSQLRTIAHDGKGMYVELGQAGEHFARIYATAISASPSELEGMLDTLRSEASRLVEALSQFEEPPSG